ncbi:hypothetical protein JKP88DRAFT_323754 [Tribonema minus]|uniref:RRM domain-containing protein n=1 Tax=Tribonema minus TaxID=303371 RepID=A0A836CDW8_9STRA|nr:hypothetical protein JKP88DRAFT_323754 [Tribonema minus]
MVAPASDCCNARQTMVNYERTPEAASQSLAAAPPCAAPRRVLTVNIKRDRSTSKNLGYGFVRMGSHAEACVAKERMHRAEVHGRRIRVGWAQKNAALAVSGLPDGVTAEQVKALFRPFGALEEENTQLMTDGSGTAVVKYRNRLHAEDARRQLNGSQALGPAPLRVDWSAPAGGAVGGAQSKAAPHRGGREATAPAPCRVQVMLEGEAASDLQEVEETVLRLFQDFAPLVSVSTPRAEAARAPSAAKAGQDAAAAAAAGGGDAAGAAAATAPKEAAPATGMSAADALVADTQGLQLRPRPLHKPARPQRAYCAVTFPPTRAGQARAMAAMAAISGTVTPSGLKVTCSLIRSEGRSQGRSSIGGAPAMHGTGPMSMLGGAAWHGGHPHAPPVQALYYVRAPYDGSLRDQTLATVALAYNHMPARLQCPRLLRWTLRSAQPASEHTSTADYLQRRRYERRRNGNCCSTDDCRGLRGTLAAYLAYQYPHLYGAAAAAAAARQGTAPGAEGNDAMAYYHGHTPIGYLVVPPRDGPPPMMGFMPVHPPAEPAGQGWYGQAPMYHPAAAGYAAAYTNQARQPRPRFNDPSASSAQGPSAS